MLYCIIRMNEYFCIFYCACSPLNTCFAAIFIMWRCFAIKLEASGSEWLLYSKHFFFIDFLAQCASLSSPVEVWSSSTASRRSSISSTKASAYTVSHFKLCLWDWHKLSIAKVLCHLLSVVINTFISGMLHAWNNCIMLCLYHVLHSHILRNYRLVSMRTMVYSWGANTAARAFSGLDWGKSKHKSFHELPYRQILWLYFDSFIIYLDPLLGLQRMHKLIRRTYNSLTLKGNEMHQSPGFG